jgi:16S rRNA (cytosine967-C5)-methyltransferase
VLPQKPREIAVRVLLDREAKRGFTEDLLDRALAGAALSSADRGLAQELAFGVVRWQTPLDWLIDRKTGGRTQKAALRVLLRMGLYQLFWLSRIPDHAAVNESVDLARQFGCGPQSGFVNAVLRGYLRERAETRHELDALKERQPAVGYSHPEWLIKRWSQRLSPEEMRDLLSWNNTPPRTFARANLLKVDVNALREQWAREKVEAKLLALDWAPGAMIFELGAFPSLATLPSFQSGLFYIQDPSTLLAVAELDPQPAESVLDLCAAPGGKTAFAVERMKNQGEVVAHDATDQRIALVKENCARLGATIVRTMLPSELKASGQTFDRILADAPCSNTGVMRRRVDLRWRIRAEEIGRLQSLQLELLKDAVARLRPGGTLVYSTCSLEPEENQEVIKSFLAGHPEMHFQSERALTPWGNGVDGAYVAKMRKGSAWN